MLFHSSTGVPVVDAQEDFRRARRAHVAARLVHRARVPGTVHGAAGVPRGQARLEVIPLEAIVGTAEPTNTFDARFRPASELVRSCWEGIALAHRRGVALPPIRELSERTEPWERASLLGFNHLVSGATGAGLTLLGGVALTAGGVAALAVEAVVLVTIPAVWVLLGGPRRDASQFGNDHPRRRPCTCTRDCLNPETTR